MTVLCIGYEDKVSRLFWKIKRELSLTQPQINFKIYSIFLSGYLFSLFRLVSCSWVSITAWIQTQVKSKFYGKLLVILKGKQKNLGKKNYILLIKKNIEHILEFEKKRAIQIINGLKKMSKTDV